MKQIVKFGLIFLLCGFVGVAFATHLTTSRVQLSVPGQGSVAPKQMVKISLDPIPYIADSFLAYDVKCNIVNSSYDPNDKLMMHFDIEGSVFDSDDSTVFLNREYLPWNNGELMDGNVLRYQAIEKRQGKGGYVTFTNLDSNRSVRIVSCYAVPSDRE